MKEHSLTMIDDALIKAGRLILLMSGVGFLALHLQQVPVPVWVDYLINSALIGSLLFIALGVFVRQREKTSLRLWNLLQHNPDTRVSALVTQSRFSMADIRRAVRSVNDSGIGHYILDEQNDRLYDARLEAMFTLRHECSGCGAATEITANVQQQQNFCCSYCQTPLPVESINVLRAQRRQSVDLNNSVEGLRVLQQKASLFHTRPPPRFSMLAFVILLVLFWPAAFFYAGRAALSRQRQNEKLRLLLESQMQKLTSLDGAAGRST